MRLVYQRSNQKSIYFLIIMMNICLFPVGAVLIPFPMLRRHLNSFEAYATPLSVSQTFPLIVEPYSQNLRPNKLSL